jgi:L-asparaginase II
VLAASHSAEQRHQDAVLSALDKAGLAEDALRCGIHPPLHEETARRLIQLGGSPSAVCNNCSGAHAGMLLACKAEGWPIDSYGRPDHPLQRRTLALLGQFTGLDPRRIGFAVDNCAVPTFHLPIAATAIAFARFVTGEGVPVDLAQAAARISSAMRAYPEMVGGEARFDTDLMEAAAGTILAKGGAEGFQGIGLPQLGAGLALKISDGNARPGAVATLALLRSLNALDAAMLGRLVSYASPVVHNHQGELVGRLVPVFHVEEGT